MERKIFEAALRATARITFGTTLVGCGGVVTMPDGETDPGEVSAAPGADHPDDGESGDDGEAIPHPPEVERPYAPEVPPAEVTCEAPGEDPGSWATYDEATFGCCVDALALVVPDDPEEAWGVWGAPDDATKNCCTQVLAPNYPFLWSGEPLPYPMPDDVKAACCVDKHGNVGCTPWGPPAPPAMAAEHLARWRAGASEVLALRGVA